MRGFTFAKLVLGTLFVLTSIQMSYAQVQVQVQWQDRIVEIPSENFDPNSYQSIDAEFFAVEAKHKVLQCAKEVIQDLVDGYDLDIDVDRLSYSHRIRKVFFKSSGKGGSLFNALLGVNWFVFANLGEQDYQTLVQRKSLLYKVKGDEMLRVSLSEAQKKDALQAYEEFINVKLSPVGSIYVLGDWFYFRERGSGRLIAIDLTLRGLEIIPTIGNAPTRYAIYCSPKRISKQEQEAKLQHAMVQSYEPEDPDPLNPWTWPIINWTKKLEDNQAFVNYFYTVRQTKADFYRALEELSARSGAPRGISIFQNGELLEKHFSPTAQKNISSRVRDNTIGWLDWDQTDVPFNITQHGGYDLNIYAEQE